MTVLLVVGLVLQALAVVCFLYARRYVAWAKQVCLLFLMTGLLCLGVYALYDADATLLAGEIMLFTMMIRLWKECP